MPQQQRFRQAYIHQQVMHRPDFSMALAASRSYVNKSVR